MVMTTEVLRNMLYERSDTLDRPDRRRDGRGALPPGPVPRRRLGGGPDPPAPCPWRSSACRRPSPTPRSSGSGSRTLRGATTRGDRGAAARAAGDTTTWSVTGCTRCTSRQDGRAGREPVRGVAGPARRSAIRSARSPRTGGRGARPTRKGTARVYVPRREEVVDTLAGAGMLPAIYFVFSRAGCDKSVRWLQESGVRLTIRARRTRRSGSGPRRGRRGSTTRTSSRSGSTDVPARRATAGIAAHHAGMLPRVQGDGRGALRGGTRQGGVRDRDPVARHQHARQDRRDRGPLEVPGRAPRAAHPRGVHAAHGAGGPPWDRRARTRGRRLPAAGAVRARRRARGHAHLRPHARRSGRRTTWRSTSCATTPRSRRTTC